MIHREEKNKFIYIQLLRKSLRLFYCANRQIVSQSEVERSRRRQRFLFLRERARSLAYGFAKQLWIALAGFGRSFPSERQLSCRFPDILGVFGEHFLLFHNVVSLLRPRGGS